MIRLRLRVSRKRHGQGLARDGRAALMAGRGSLPTLRFALGEERLLPPLPVAGSVPVAPPVGLCRHRGGLCLGRARFGAGGPVTRLLQSAS